MALVSLTGHFDGERIVLDETFELPIGAQLLVTVLPEPHDETAYLMSSPKSARRILSAIRQLDGSQGATREVDLEG